MVTQLKGNVWVLGDLNFPKLSWNNEHIPSVRPGCSFPQLYGDFISTLDDCNLVQMMTEPTRGENILDLFLTSSHTLVKNVAVHPGISDHDLVYSEVLIKPVEIRQPPPPPPSPRPHTYIEERTGRALRPIKRRSRRIFWQTRLLNRWKNFRLLFKSSVNEDLSRFVPWKKIGSKKKSLPWITQSIKRLIRKSDSLYQKHKRSSRPKDRKHFITTRHMIKAKIKQAYDRYLEDFLGINKPDPNTSPTGEAGQSKFEVKKLFSFLKNSRQDSQGIGPLRDLHTNTVYTSNTDKANLINNHLQSVLTPVSLLRLNHLSESAVLGGLADGTINEENIPGTFRRKVPEMPKLASH